MLPTLPCPADVETALRAELGSLDTIPAVAFTVPATNTESFVSMTGDEIPETVRLAALSFGSPRVPTFESCSYYAGVGVLPLTPHPSATSTRNL